MPAIDIDRLQRMIDQDLVIPIIGNTVRDEDIFDVDNNEQLEISDENGPLWKEAGYSAEQWTKFTITEKLSSLWAKTIGYPMPDRYKLEWVALFHAVNKGHEETNIKLLSYRKSLLLKVAKWFAIVDEDDETLALIDYLECENAAQRPNYDRYGFSDIAVELDFPRHHDGHVDPLQILARQPLSIYVTTDQHDFLERALRKENRNPRTRLCWLREERPKLQTEHQFDENYEPTITDPVVYHLCGYEGYPSSLVVSEDSLLDLLMWVTETDPQDEAFTNIPIYLQERLIDSSLLLLGYRFNDWDFRVVFRSMLQLLPDTRSRRETRSFAIQLDMDRDTDLIPSEDDIHSYEADIRNYLETYFDQEYFDIHLGPIEGILRTLE